MRGPAKRASLSEANLTVLYRNLTFTTFTDLFEIHQKMESYIMKRIRGALFAVPLGKANLVLL